MTAPAVILPPGVALSPLARLLRAAGQTQQDRAGNIALQLHARLYAGDLWAEGKGWSGPRPDPTTDRSPTNVARVAAEIERTFVSRNLAKDIVDRHQAGVAGREPLWSVVPRRQGETDKETDRLLAEYTDALTDWWDDSGAWPAVQQAVRTALTTGRGTVRLYLHASRLDELPDGQRGVPAGLSLSEAARRVSIHAPAWDQAGVTRDRDGHVTGAYHRWQDDSGTKRWEIHERQGDRTVVHPDLLAGGTDNVPATAYPVPDLLIYELKLDPLVTDSVRRLLLAANKTLTMGSRNIDLGGFLERTILNAQLPGEYKTLADGSKKFVPDPLNVGAGASNAFVGAPVYGTDAQGKRIQTGYATPSIVYKEPSAYDVFKMSFEQLREAILDEANQLHVMIAGDASASGVSRQQAVNDFLSSLEPTRIALEQLTRWLLDTVLRLALHFTNRLAEADALRLRAQARISAVQPTPAEIDQALKLHEAGLISEERALNMVGVEDVGAERRVRRDEGITPALALRILDRAPAWVGLQALALAFPALEITPDQVAAQRDLDLAAPTAPADLSLEDPNADAQPSA